MARKRQPQKTRRDVPPRDVAAAGDTHSAADHRRRWKQSLLGAALVVSAVLLAIGLAALWIHYSGTTADDGRAEAVDPRLTYETEYRNVRPDVKYVGDQSCAACHEAQCSSYAQHPMKRTLQPL